MTEELKPFPDEQSVVAAGALISWIAFLWRHA
jgi:hypothetical protein